MSMPLGQARSWSAFSLVIALGLSGACSDDSVATPDAGPPSIELGTGNPRFEPIVDGATIPVITGPQGGYHLLGSLRAANINPGDPENLQDTSNPTTQFEVFANGVRVDAEASTYTQGLRTADNGVEMVGRFIILDIPNANTLNGTELRFVVTLRDVDGIVVSDERRVIANGDL